MINKAKIILKKVFGYENFRNLQEKIIKNVLDKKDTLAIMPTGSGKSICYQIPSQIFEGITIVISPLISLMKDQVEQMNQIGIEAVLLNSSLMPDEYSYNVNRLLSGDAKLLYLAPERLFLDKTISLLSSLKVECITIDEAHCISEWGHDFRPDYRQLVDVREMYPEAVCLALTATATPRVQKDIKEILNFEDSNEFIASFDRKNLFLQVEPKTDAISQTIEFISKFKDESGIIYCLTRKKVEEVAEILQEQNFSVRPYHAGLDPINRSKNQDMFIKDDVSIIVATVAFGMGINKPDVRFVVHYDLPKNIESYYQQIGRAGRDGLKSYCLLLYSYGDTKKIEYFIKNMENRIERKVAKEHLRSLISFAETFQCRRSQLLTYFGERYNKKNCEMCDNCLGEDTDIFDLTIPAQKFLSCVKRTDELFGVNYIVDVLRGSTAQKVIENGHNELSTYAIGKDLTRKQWLHLSRQLLNEEFVTRGEDYGSLLLTPKAWRLFRNKEKFFGTHLIEERKEKITQSYSRKVNYDETLFEILRKKRKELADTYQVPPYAIFHDTSLIEMCRHYPHSRSSMLNITGVGETKFEKYGQIFMDIIVGYCSENNFVEKPKKRSQIKKDKKKMKSQKKFVTVGELYNGGHTIDELMKKFNVTRLTILSNLLKYYNAGYTLNPDGFLDNTMLNEKDIDRVIDAFTRLGSYRLKPVFDELKEEISYEELHLLRLYFLTKEDD